ncbi:hypothetical protein [Flavobacterium gelatinilyticum]|mgnify:CR=1 FL=1|uniref:hypothetical protein n=1 Tax=Flavobacterium gelatinilyticum TaxID=3003260 RepID=UPI00247FFDD5|nr:hypothetical protein [Flavobacterium gelatinilyticum]
MKNSQIKFYKKDFFILLILCLLFSQSYSQNKKSADCWEANTSYNDTNFKENYYNLIFQKDSMNLSINHKYQYKFKIYRDKKSRYFYLDNDKMILQELDIDKNKYLFVKYSKKREVQVNEITMVRFAKCL